MDDKARFPHQCWSTNQRQFNCEDFIESANCSVQRGSSLFRFNSFPGQDYNQTDSLKHRYALYLQRPSISVPCSCSSKVASKKATTTTITKPGEKMDTCVPSPNLMNNPFAPSPHSLSIYDHDRPSMFYGCSKVNNDVDVSGYTTEDIGPLDENFENSSLKNILTPELINSIASSSSFPSSYNNWESKYNPEESQDPSTSTDPTFMLSGIDSELLISDLLNIDSNDSKFSFPGLDFESMTSNPPSSCHTPVPMSEPKSEFTDTSADRFNPIPSRSKDSIGQDFVQKKFTMKSNFPPRKADPPVGVVAPVKIPEEDNKNFDHHLIDLKTVVKVPKKEHLTPAIQTISSATPTVDMSELPPQTVPSFGISNQKGLNHVKIEPVSPEFHKREPVKRSITDTTEDKWEEVKHFMQGDEEMSPSKSKRRRYDSGSSAHTSEDGDEDDNDYVYNNDDDSDDDADLDADLAHIKPGDYESLVGGGKKQKQYFWQYNVQAKGPKGTRLKLAVESPSDPHVLNGFEDPVFDEGNTTVAGIRHGGKARKGDGNEVTPNPHKLFKIGHQLLRLNKKINACQLGSDVPLTKRNESRKEKNKLASRACRLKKKAQHEANKIKLNGLEMEHGQINNVLRLIWPELRERAKAAINKMSVDEKYNPENSVTNKLTDYISSNLKSMVAGNTTDYVNNVIMTVERGDMTGGLKVKSRKT